MDIWYILRPFGTFCVDLVHFSGFGTMYQEKSGNPRTRSRVNRPGANPLTSGFTTTTLE
jgi:hypothetical protein